MLCRKAGLAWFAGVIGVAAAAAAWPATSSTTIYAPATAIGFAAFASGWVCLFGATYLGACVGAEDHEQNTIKELHLAGRGRTEVLWERVVAVAIVSLAMPSVAVLTAAWVVAGEMVAQHLRAAAPASATSAPLFLFSAALIGSLFSGFMGFALAWATRSRLLGFLGWLGLTFAYASLVPAVSDNALVATVLRYVPSGPLLDAFLGQGNYLDRNLSFSATSAVVSFVGTTAALLILLAMQARTRSLA